MTSFKAIKVEMKLDGASWTDVTADIRVDDQYTLEYGIVGHSPTDRTAGIGKLKFGMDNSQSNSAGLLGYYSPGHTNARSGFEVNVPVRMTLDAGTYYGDDYYGDFYYGGSRIKFIGNIFQIRVEPGQKAQRITRCTAYDFIYEMSKHKMKTMAIATSVASGTAFSNIIGNMGKSPDATEYDTGQDIFAYHGDDIRDERTSALSAIKRVVISEFGYAYIKGDEATGGVLVFEDRHHRVNTIPLFSLDDGEINLMAVNRPLDQIFNVINVTSNPREAGGSPEVVYTFQTTMLIEANTTVNITGRYTDPSNRNARIGAINMVSLVAGTDYKFGSTEGSGTNDKEGDLSVTETFGANSVELALENTSGGDGYVNLLQARGTALRTYEPVVMTAEDADSKTAYDHRKLDINARYQDSPLIAQERANALLAAYKDPQTLILKMGFTANSGLKARAIAKLEPGDRITLGESVTGISATDFIIHHVHLRFRAPDIIQATYLIRLATTEQAWLLEVVNYGELGDTTILGGATI